MQFHERASKYWRETVANKARDPSHQVNLQAWILYFLRFILTGDLCNSWKDSGGLSSKLHQLSIVPHLGITENDAFEIAYDGEIRSRLQRLARRSDTMVDFAKLLIDENEEVKRYLTSALGKGRPPHGIHPLNKKQQPSQPGQKAKKCEKAYNPNFAPQGGNGGKTLTLIAGPWPVASRART